MSITREQYEKAFELYEEGWPIPDVAKRLGLTYDEAETISWKQLRDPDIDRHTVVKAVLDETEDSFVVGAFDRLGVLQHQVVVESVGAHSFRHRVVEALRQLADEIEADKEF